MKRLVSSLPAKIVAIFLITLSVVFGALTAISCFILYENGFYEGMSFTPPYMSVQITLPGIGTLLILLALDTVVFLLLLIFLLGSAGHRAGTEGISLGWQDQIPLDLYLALALSGSILLLSVGDELFGLGLLWSLLAIVCFIGIFLLLLAVSLTCAARLKAGQWWRNTVVFYALGLLRRLLSRLASAATLIPMIWRTGLLFCGATFLNFFLALWFFEDGGDPLAFFIGVVFNGFLLVAFCRLSLMLQKLRNAGEHLAAGDSEYKVDTRGMYWDFKRHGENLNRVGEGIAAAVARQMKSERLKTELITNVSHDIKTPLTSILNYVDLLSKEHLEGRGAEYLEVLDRQANRLKKLTEDLVEASKASTGNLPVNLARTDVCELVRQAAGEYTERLANRNLESILTTSEEPLFILADGRLLWRVLDNLLGNVCKYALPGTRVYLDVTLHADQVILSVKNISRDRLNVDAEELIERFVRGEASRTTEGSGLGLNIARSLTELQKGIFRLAVDGDLFKAELQFQKML